MHKGRRYPFHPSYWATESWYWPGFVPWKLWASAFPPLAGPWASIPSGWTGVSSPGVPSIDAKKIVYDFSVAGVPDPFTFAVLMKMNGTYPVVTARWEVYTPSTGTELSAAVLDQGFPQTVVFCPGFPSYTLPWNGGTGAGPGLMLEPATYAQGGSPWD